MVSMSPGVQERFLGAPTGRHEAKSCGTVPVNNNRRQNNALQRTGREGAALLLRRGPVVEARPAAEREC